MDNSIETTRQQPSLNEAIKDEANRFIREETSLNILAPVSNAVVELYIDPETGETTVWHPGASRSPNIILNLQRKNSQRQMQAGISDPPLVASIEESPSIPFERREKALAVARAYNTEQIKKFLDAGGNQDHLVEVNLPEEPNNFLLVRSKR